MKPSDSIFRTYYTKTEFVDRYQQDRERAFTVIIPIIHTNELWEENLRSIYREVPVARLLIGDGGCVDDSVEIAKSFPRVEVLDHRAFTSLGYSLRKLIEAVDTEWFAYFHSDVYLPDGWFDAMYPHRDKYDWYGCRMMHTVMVEYDLDYGLRPYAGTQLGRTACFVDGVQTIDDDYVYRQEDFVFSDIVRRAGGREGKIDEVFHYHQTMRKASPWFRKVTSVGVDLEMSKDEEVRTWDMQVRGIIKYLQPDNEWVIRDAVNGLHRLVALDVVTTHDFYEWTARTNAVWLPYLKRGMRWRRAGGVYDRIIDGLRGLVRRFR